jgi:tRNA(Ile)-lysidine synthase
MPQEKTENLIEKVERFCLEQKLFKRGDKIIIGFSGGADSTALLTFFYHIRSRYRLSLLAAHVNYHLRGSESKRDEEFVQEFCFHHNISLVKKDAKLKEVKNVENQAREIRMEYFQKLLKLYKANKIALAHQREDQAETVLFRFMRGAGLHGLSGIEAKHFPLIHPFLPVSKAEITAFLQAENISWREDSSNHSLLYSRNKIRNQMIPWIEENINSNIVNHIHTLSFILSDADDILQDLARKKLNQMQTGKEKEILKLDIQLLKKCNSTLRFYIYQNVYQQICNHKQDFYHIHFQNIEAILPSSGSKQIFLPHEVVVLKEYDELSFLSQDSLQTVNVENSREITSIRTRFSFEDFRISMKKYKLLPKKRYVYENKEEAFFDYDKISFPLVIRHRQPGDKFIPFGMTHSKKLKDFFIDEKVPKFERDKLLVFADSEKIIWIGEMRIDARVALDENTKNILKLRIDKITQHKVRHAERIKK